MSPRANSTLVKYIIPALIAAIAAITAAVINKTQTPSKPGPDQLGDDHITGILDDLHSKNKPENSK